MLPNSAVLIGTMWSADLSDFGPAAEEFGSIQAVGRELFTNWLYPFEVLSLLIVAAMVGAVVIAKKRVVEDE